jgi:hypothetical protein
VRRGEAQNRLDAKYFALRETVTSARYPLRALGTLVSQEPDYGSVARAVPRTGSHQPRYIRITDFGDDGIELGHEYVTADPIELECVLSAGDLLFARSGATVGKTYLHEDTSVPAIFGGYCIRFRLDREQALPQFVYHFTKTSMYERWTAAIQRPSGQPNINKEEFKGLLLPVPPVTQQQKLVAAVDAARVGRRTKLAKADALLSGIDACLLSALRIARAPDDNRKAFAVRAEDARSQGRLNSDYFHPERVLVLRTLESAAAALECVRLEETVTFERQMIKTPGDNYIGMASIRSHTGELVRADETAGGSCVTYRRGDVLFARLRPYLNKVHRAQTDGCCSTEFHVLRVRDSAMVDPDYLAIVLRSQLTLAQTVHMMTGNTHPRLANDDVVNLVIPVPKRKVQERIVAESHRRREEAQVLRAEAGAGWHAAKTWFEDQLLGPGNP